MLLRSAPVLTVATTSHAKTSSRWPGSLTTGHLSLGSKDIWILLARMTSCSQEWFQCWILSLPPALYLDFGTWKTVGRCDNPRVRGELQK